MDKIPQEKCEKMTIEQAERLVGWKVEEKVDGSRSFFNGTKFVSPERATFKNERYTHILNELKGINCVIDGEIYFPDGCVSDATLTENWKKCKYAVFDLLEIDGFNTTKLPLWCRSAMLKALVKGMVNVHFVREFKSAREGWDYAKKNDKEGIVIKNLQSAYVDKRSRDWIKVKNYHEITLEIVGYEEGSEKGAFILSNGGRMSALSADYVAEYKRLSAKGVNSKVFAEIEYLYKTKAGKLFQPVLKRLVAKLK